MSRQGECLHVRKMLGTCADCARPDHGFSLSRPYANSSALRCLQAKAVRRLLAYRLDTGSQEAARSEWLAIVEGQHPLWTGVSQPYKHTIRAFLVHFHTAILRHSTERFNFQNGSVGASSCPPMQVSNAGA